MVALRKESVDRNACVGVGDAHLGVALRKESVDRNVHGVNAAMGAAVVALRKESVDRNGVTPHCQRGSQRSLSARRAWIEIAQPCKRRNVCRVALRKESVDRNGNKSDNKKAAADVALRKESVDRNMTAYASNAVPDGRSPQGERG